MKLRSTQISTETLVWLLLSSLTVASWALSAYHNTLSSPALLNSLLVIIAFLKIRFVIMHFMEVRSGPPLLRLSCDAWLFISAGGLLFFLLR